MIDMPMKINLVEGNPRIEEVRNQVAIQRGPVVYCLESPDLPKDINILDVSISGNSQMEVIHKPKFLGGVSIIKGSILLRSNKMKGLYSAIKNPKWISIETSFVPYYAWSNRGLAEMTVFLPVVWGQIDNV